MDDYKKLVIFIGILVLGFSVAVIYFSWPLLTGKTYVLATQPVDPFDLFRGQYITIRYDISNIINSKTTPNSYEGENIYVLLKKDNEGIYQYEDYSLVKPNQGDFIRGKIKSLSEKNIIIEYGIETYFFQRNAEFNTRGMSVEVKVDSLGQARISRLMKDGKELYINYSKSV